MPGAQALKSSSSSAALLWPCEAKRLQASNKARPRSSSRPSAHAGNESFHRAERPMCRHCPAPAKHPCAKLERDGREPKPDGVAGPEMSLRSKRIFAIRCNKEPKATQSRAEGRQVRPRYCDLQVVVGTCLPAQPQIKRPTAGDAPRGRCAGKLPHRLAGVPGNPGIDSRRIIWRLIVLMMHATQCR